MRGHNEGSLYRRTVTRADGTVWRPWIAAVTINGRRRTKYARTKAEQKANLKDLLEQRDLGLGRDDPSLAEYLPRWLTEKRAGLRYEGWADCDLHARHLVAGLGGIKVRALTIEQVNTYLRGVLADGAAPQTVKNRRGVLRNALNGAIRKGMIARNVAALSQAPRVEKKLPDFLNPDEASHLLEAERDDRMYALWAVAILTGQRESELLGLTWDDVDLEGGSMAVEERLARRPTGKVRRGRRVFDFVRVPPKTAGSRHLVPLAPLAVDALREWRVAQAAELELEQGLVFTDTKGAPWERTKLGVTWHKALAKAGLRAIRFHDLRHTAATIALSSGYTLEDVKQLLGHSTIVLTSNTYSHPLASRQRDVVAGMEATLTRSRTRSRTEPGTAREGPGERPV